MPRELNIQSVKGRMPVRYRVNPYGKFFSIVLHLAICLWCLYVIVSPNVRTQDWSVFYRVLPYVVLFVSLDSLFRHLTSLYALIFTPECLWFRYILRPSIAVEYDRILSMELRRMISYYMFLTFTDRNGSKRIIKTPASFPRMIEIMYNIADIAPQLVMNDELNKMIEVIRKYKASQEQA